MAAVSVVDFFSTDLAGDDSDKDKDYIPDMEDSGKTLVINMKLVLIILF